MFDRHSGGESAILVHIDFQQSLSQEKNQEDLQEFVELVRSAGLEVMDIITAKRSSPDPKFFIGSGKIDEIKSAKQATNANVIIFNHNLSPAQERNIERAVEARVIDRIGLILDIFAQRASTFEGKLQVELAQLRHLSTRLIRGWTHLERQKGGIGLRGPGETQLETDRRLLRERIKYIDKRLERVSKQREQGRRSRKRANIKTISIVGYTNAGKSTLFNYLTTAGVLAEDKLFATLDPTLRRISLPQGTDVIIADTVGFIRHLPHELVAAFRATLEESVEADVLLHVIDAASERREENMEQVEEVLSEIGATDIPRLEVYNKIDLIEGAEPHVDRDDKGRPIRVWISVLKEQGIELLREAIEELAQEEQFNAELRIPPHQGRLRGLLYELQAVESENTSDNGDILLTISLPKSDWIRLGRQLEKDLSPFVVN
ncbi:GTPase HflX [Kangiella profundi]|uniref:GTPase HflX n=1 Tax=Kangiella profundi TaxID=1561924 RepID=A0A2K9A9N7_9GAMM|nr:ribosome rescue GTPase HflX [Kangiella profundi]AUD78137.1 GTPase HflX [Kangiella profundi]GGF05381.1 GTPase HflX [Kangiella profundi]